MTAGIRDLRYVSEPASPLLIRRKSFLHCRRVVESNIPSFIITN